MYPLLFSLIYYSKMVSFLPVNGVTSLDIVDKTEIFSSLFNLDDIHETGWESGISSHFAVNLDEPLLHNSAHFLGSQGILQTISQEH